jgi:hypothetical protein
LRHIVELGEHDEKEQEAEPARDRIDAVAGDQEPRHVAQSEHRHHQAPGQRANRAQESLRLAERRH